MHFSDDCQLDFTIGQVCTAVRTRLSHRLIEFQVDLPMGCFQLLRWFHSSVHLSDNFQMEFTKGKVQPALRTQLTHLLTDFQVDLQRGCFHFSVQCRFSNGYIIQDTFRCLPIAGHFQMGCCQIFRWQHNAVHFSDDVYEGLKVRCNESSLQDCCVQGFRFMFKL
jgi:hypothetical protein